MSGLLKFNENFELELEIINSMYDNVKVFDSSSSSSSIYSIIELVLVPRVLSSSSFVEATIQLHIPNAYVDNSKLDLNDTDDYSFLPKLVIVRTSGLSDEGRQLLLSIQKLYKTFLPGDQVLYQLIEAAYEYLDSVNEGECLICTDTLALPTSSSSSLSFSTKSSLSPSQLYSLRLPSCYHCYHTSCLCKWAAILMTTGKNQKEIMKKEEIEANNIRYLLIIIS